MDRTGRTKIQSIYQALLAASSSIKLAKRLLGELEQQSGPSPRELPGEFGTYDGHFMVTEGGEKYPIPENYASKSKLVYGDKLKRIVQDDGSEVFKQIERVRRQELAGILAKKDGNWHAVTANGSYEVLDSAVKYWDGKGGEEAIVIVPQDEKRVPFAALKEIHRETPEGEEKVEEAPEPVIAPKMVEEKVKRVRGPKKVIKEEGGEGSEAKAEMETKASSKSEVLPTPVKPKPSAPETTEDELR